MVLGLGSLVFGDEFVFISLSQGQRPKTKDLFGQLIQRAQRVLTRHLFAPLINEIGVV